MSSDEECRGGKRRCKFQNERTNDEHIEGPALPPNLPINHLRNEPEGPALPPSFPDNRQDPEGPALPPDFSSIEKPLLKEVQEGPALPPYLLPKELQNKFIGPQLPSELAKPLQQLDKEKSLIGPCLPPGFTMTRSNVLSEDEEEEEDDFTGIGPDPRLMASGSELNKAKLIEEREEKARRKMLGLDKEKPKRETWMLELPPEKAANLGLGPRQFRAKGPVELGDRSVWTDTPEEAAKKSNIKKKPDPAEELRKKRLKDRDEEMERIAKRAERKMDREESLLDKHAKKMAKEKQKEDQKPQERRRFNRETDLQVNRFDEAQKKSILKKAQLLNDRFSSGENKFL